jgi:hypothetical protein
MTTRSSSGVRRKWSAARECLIVPEPVNPQDGSPPETDDGVQAQVDWQVDLVEQRRQGREQELWSIPAISVAAQAFLFTTGLEAGTSPAARIILAVVGLLTAVGTMLVVLRQAARVYIAEQWMEEIHGAHSVWALEEQLVAKRAAAGQASATSVLERLPRWILGPDQHFQISTAHVWTALLIAFAVVDLLVIASSFDGWHLLKLAK